MSLQIPTKVLTHDEDVTLTRGGNTIPNFRLRVWSGGDGAPIALATWPDAFGKLCMANNWSLAKLANYAHSAILGFPYSGFLFYEMHESTIGEKVVSQCIFDYAGQCNHRLMMFNPRKHRVPLAVFEGMIGHKLEGEC